MKKDSRVELSILIPVYNEANSIERTICEIHDRLKSSGISYEVIVVNDGSTDGSDKIIANIPEVRLISHPVNRGYGASLKTGIRLAEGIWICITDADGTYPNQRIPELYEYTKSYDMVVGARIGSSVTQPAHRSLGKWFLIRLANYLTNTKIPDLNSGLRMFRKDDITRFFGILSNGFSFTTTSTLAYLSNGYIIKYLPIDYYKREGVSKIRPVNDGINFILLIIRAISYFNPLKIFLPISLLFFTLSFFALVISALVLGRIMDATTIALFLSGVQIALFGLIADIIVKRSSLR